MKRPVLGLQFVELNRKATRSSGIFFKGHNGKEKGKLTNVRSNSKSLVSGDPAEVWRKLEEAIATHARAYARGEFVAQPKRADKECQSCPTADLCGFRRKTSDGLLEEAEAVGGGE
jgi:hypothetical protein